VRRTFLVDEEAQATTEYVLILAVMVSLGILIVRDLIKPVLTQFTDKISKLINEQLFKDGGSMHQSPFKAP
jgi:Flp pilus assembly pilin Flp